jgi:hypothetical protein
MNKYWIPAGRVTLVGRVLNPASCMKVCEQACNDNPQRYCFYDNKTGDCRIASGHQPARLNHHYYAGTPWRCLTNILSDDQRKLNKMGNKGTFKCADEGQWCGCHGTISYAVRYKPWNHGGGEYDWTKIHDANIARRQMAVRGGSMCTNHDMRGDPAGDEKKSCWCHPLSHKGQLYKDPPPQDWTKEKCEERYKNKSGVESFFLGMWTGFECTGLCPLSAIDAWKSGGGTIPIGQCSHACYCMGKGWGL